MFSPRVAGNGGFERNVLLLDAVEPRQLARAAAMRHAGATVQCVASGAAARALWKPGSYQLVIIELDGAGADARQFYEYARTLSIHQAFAFYIAEPPYLARTPGAGPRRAVAPAPPPPPPSRWEISFVEASQQMKVARAAGRARRAATPPAPARPSFAEAVKAAELDAAARNGE